MIPTNTLRERMREALTSAMPVAVFTMTVEQIDHVTQTMIEAIGDPVLINTADTKEPTFTLRAQDKAAVEAIGAWIEFASEHDCPEEKLNEVLETHDAFLEWRPRKWPD